MTVYTEGCAKCGTEDTGRFTDGDDVCLDCEPCCDVCNDGGNCRCT